MLTFAVTAKAPSTDCHAITAYAAVHVPARTPSGCPRSTLTTIPSSSLTLRNLGASPPTVLLGHYSTVGNRIGELLGGNLLVEAVGRGPVGLMYETLYKMHQRALPRPTKALAGDRHPPVPLRTHVKLQLTHAARRGPVCLALRTRLCQTAAGKGNWLQEEGP